MKLLLENWRKFSSLDESTWYRGATTNTEVGDFSWLSQDKEHAMQYMDMNKAIHGGEAQLKSYNVDLSKYNLEDLSEYDMDEHVDEDEIEEFLGDFGVDLDIEDIFDFSEDSIPLSRLVNKILPALVAGKDGLKVKEGGVLTVFIKTSLLGEEE
tara:strand:+ start:346 stop:807 length:462 start_codon:yes stop_codon:yes gene_type:complete